MKKRVTRYLIYGQTLFILGLAVAVIIKPEVIIRNDAISIYGSSKSTIIPYAAGFVGTIYFLLKAASLLAKDNTSYKQLSIMLKLLAIALTGLIASPLTVNMDFYHAHLFFGIASILIELGVAIYLIARVHQDIWQWLIFLSFIVGTVVRTLSASYIGIYHLLAVGQLLATFAFAGLLIRSVMKLESSN